MATTDAWLHAGQISRNLDTGRLRQHFLDAGQGPLVVCLHGFPDSPLTFAPQIGALVEAGYRVVAPYLRGYSPSEGARDGDYSVAALGLDVIALLDALDVERAVLVGHDYGASTAYAAALAAPQRVRGLVTLAVPHGPELSGAILLDALQRRRSWYIFFFQTPLAELAFSLDGGGLIDQLWRDWSPGWMPPEDHLRDVKRMLTTPGTWEAALGYYRAPFTGRFGGEPAAALQQRLLDAIIEVPCTYLHGRNDGCIGVEVSAKMGNYFRADFRRLIVEQVGHFLHLERPEAVNQAMLDALGRLSRHG